MYEEDSYKALSGGLCEIELFDEPVDSSISFF